MNLSAGAVDLIQNVAIIACVVAILLQNRVNRAQARINALLMQMLKDRAKKNDG